MGDEGGITCHLDFGFDDTKEVQIVSIVHLKFDRRDPLAQEIVTYRAVLGGPGKASGMGISNQLVGLVVGLAETRQAGGL